MSSNLTQNNSVSFNSIPSAQLLQSTNTNIIKQEISRTQDTIASVQKEEKKQQTASVGERPTLPGANSKHPQYLMILAEAFSQAFDSMSKGAIAQTKSFTKLQALDQTMSQAVLLSTKYAVDKQNHEIKISAKVASYEKKEEKTNEILGWVTLGLAVVVIIVSVVAACFGAPDEELLPEEGEMLEGGIEMEEMGDPDPAPSESDGPSDSNEPQPISESGEPSELGDTDDVNQQNQARETTDELSKSNEENSESEDKTKNRAKKVGKRLMHMGVTFIFGTPMLVKGITSLKTSGMEKTLAGAEKEVGSALSQLQKNDSYFKFYQQLLQRDSGVTGEETNDASQVVETFGDITNAYKNVASGLANAV